MTDLIGDDHALAASAAAGPFARFGRRAREVVRAWQVVLGTTGVGVVAAVFSSRMQQRLVVLAVGLVCAGAAGQVVRQAYIRSRRGRPLSRGVVLIGSGLVLLVGSSLAGDMGKLAAGPTPSPVTQIAAGLGAALIVCGLVVPVPGGLRGWELNNLLEAAIIAAVLLFSTWAMLANQGQAITVSVVAPSLIRPALDLMIVLLVLARSVSEARHRYSMFPWRLLVTAAVLELAADTARSMGLLGAPHVPNSIIGLLTLLTLVLFAAGALHPDTVAILELAGAAPAKLNRVRLGVVMAAVVAGPLALVAGGGQVHGGQIALGTVVLSGLSVAYLVGRVEEGSRSEHLALHDELTGLPKRLLFADRVGAAVRQADRSADAWAVMFLDLDRFKTINDSLGHAAGNELLRLVGQRLTHAIRDEDTVARLGGDEFSILLPGLAHADAKLAAERILMAFLLPFNIAGRDLFVTPSIGIAIGPADGHDVDTLLKNADAAMYRAKAAGRNTFRQYSPEMNAHAHKRLAIESNLHTAIARGELVLFYQPKVDVRTMSMVGMEALVRWQHPERGLLGPDEFVPLAEETGLIVPLGEWVLETACRQTQAWREEGHELVVAVNLSARQFQHQEMADVVARALRRTGLPPENLELELTETVALENPVATTATLQTIKRMGSSCSIDDFGTGYSGLSYLTRLPIDKLKIDKVFIDQIANGTDEGRIVAAVIALAHELGMTVIAEGVETIEQMDFLRANGCDHMQGFLVSPPVPSEEFSALLGDATGDADAAASPAIAPADPAAESPAGDRVEARVFRTRRASSLARRSLDAPA